MKASESVAASVRMPARCSTLCRSPTGRDGVRNKCQGMATSSTLGCVIGCPGARCGPDYWIFVNVSAYAHRGSEPN